MSDEDYKTRGKQDDPDGAGVLGYNTASSGTAKGVEGRTDSPEGYGLYTDDAAHVGGTVEAGSVRTDDDNGRIVVQPEWSATDLNARIGPGAHLQFKPATTYVYTQESIKLHPGMTVAGPGPISWEYGESRPDGTTVVVARHDGPAFEPVTNGVSAVTMRDLTIDGDRENTAGGYCLNLGEQIEQDGDPQYKYTVFFQRFHLENLALLEAPEGGIYADRAFNGVIKDCTFRRFGRADGSNNADSFYLTKEGGSVPSHFKFVNNDFRGGSADDCVGRDHVHVTHCQGFHAVNNDINHANRNLVWIKNNNGGEFTANRGEPASETENGFVFGYNGGDEGDTDGGRRVIGARIVGNHSHASGRSPSGTGLDLRRVGRTVVRANSISGYSPEISTNPDSDDGYVNNCEFGTNVPPLGSPEWDQEPGASGELVDTTRVRVDSDDDVTITDGTGASRLWLFAGGLTAIRNGTGATVAQARGDGAFRLTQGELEVGENGATLETDGSTGALRARSEDGETNTFLGMHSTRPSPPNTNAVYFDDGTARDAGWYYTTDGGASWSGPT